MITSVIVLARSDASIQLLIATPPKFTFTTTLFHHISSFGMMFHDVCGTNNSGHFSPTRIGTFHATCQPFANQDILSATRFLVALHAFETVDQMSAPTFCARLRNSRKRSIALSIAFTKTFVILSATFFNHSRNIFINVTVACRHSLNFPFLNVIICNVSLNSSFKYQPKVFDFASASAINH